MATVVYQSVVDEYLSATTREAFAAGLGEAGRRATAASPLAWLRLEPRPGEGRFDLTLTRWPGGRAERLAECGGHGAGVRWRS